jgi:hypothetical protein
MSISIENSPFLNDIDVFWDSVEDDPLPMSNPDFRAKKESNREFRGVAKTRGEK